MMAIGAALPIFIVIMSGYFLRRHFLKSQEFWKQIDNLIYYFLLPITLVQILASAKLEFSMLHKGLAIFAITTLIGMLCFVFKRFMKASNPEFTSVFQGVVRVNFYMSLSASSLLYGEQGVQFLSFLLIFLIPSATVYSVLVLERYGSAHKAFGIKGTLLRLAKNPIVISTALGLGIDAAFGGLPDLADKTLDIFGDATLPLALLGVGATLDFSALKISICPLFWACLLRPFVAPVLCVLLCLWLGFNAQETICCALIFAVPSAASSITFSSQMGGDTRLMSSILTIQTLCSFITLSVMVSVVQYLFS